MDSFFDNVQRGGQSVAERLSLSQLEIFLLAGSGALVIALLILAATRWGQARPVAKCVVLSIAAHVLLIAYAWGTHLIFHIPTPAHPPGEIGIRVVDEPGRDPMVADGEPDGSSETKPWDEVRALPPVLELASVDRPERVSPAPPPLPVREAPSEAPAETIASPTLTAPALDPLAAFESPPIPDPERLTAAPPLPVAPPAAAVTPPTPRRASEGIAIDRPALPDEMPSAPPANSPAEPAMPIADRSSEAIRSELAAAPTTPPAQPPVPSPPASETAPAAARASRPEADWEPGPAREIPARTTSSAPRKLDGKPVPRLYAARTSPDLLAVASRRGGSRETEAAVRNALQWLASAQEANGSWNPRRTEGGQEHLVQGQHRRGAGGQADSGISALALLAFLGHGHTHLDGPYQETIRKGLQYLINNQTANGDLAGQATFFARTYCHSMALLAISETFAITGDDRLRPAVEKGVQFTLASQSRFDGGWRYRPGDAGDMSQFGWVVLALHSAELGGVRLPIENRQKMREFLASCTRGPFEGLASYRPNEGVSTSMTAEALVCRTFLENGVGRRTRHEAAQRILESPPRADQVNYYYWYYATLAMFQTEDEQWEAWNNPLTKVLIESQRTSGPQAGSWDPVGLWSGYGGRVYSTAMATLCLEVYYRYLPTQDVAERDPSSPRR